MFKNFIYNFFSQTDVFQRFESAKSHMSRPSLSAEDFLAIFFIAGLAGVFISVVLLDYFKQRSKK